MDRDLEEELKDLRNRMTQCFQETMLARELRSAILLAVISLHLIVRERQRARDPTKQRELIREFDQGRAVLRKAIDRAFKESGVQPRPAQPAWKEKPNEDQRAA